ncbi:hypothetical protein Pfo_021606 [Paulownia fortunei]|nr:hypothetical protein Pfo_021606 [Paulownia fortunei]
MKYENYDLCFPDQPVVDLYLPIWANLPAFQHKPAFIWAEDGSGSSALTYEQLNTSVNSISSQLLLSLQRGDTVVILCAPGLELVEIIFACQRAGLLSVPITPPHPSFANDNHHHLVRVLSQAKPKAALATRSYINRVREYISSTSSSSSNNRLSELLRKLRWIATEELKGLKVDDMPWNLSRYNGYNGCKANDVYLIQYTSGATGIPKPVLVTAGAAAHNVRVARKAYDLHPNSVIVSWLPQYHDCGLMFLLLTIVSGATCVLTSPNAFIKRPRLWLELITEYKATCTPVPSFTLPLVVRRGGVDKGTSSISLGSMKNLIIINEPIYKASIEEFVEVFGPFGLIPSSISPSYGLAENCTFVSTAWRSGSDGNFPIHKDLLPSAKLPSSRDEIIEEETEILVVNEETHEPADDGIEGEIWISSPSNASGYLDHPSLTREVFNGRISNKVAGCYVRTGDRGIVIGQERYLYVTGRSSDIIKRADGLEIHPHYIETSAYNSCPRLLRAGCLAAFELLGTIAVVAELQKGEVEPKVLLKVCEGIRTAIFNEEETEVGLVILVKSGSIPKTTSGKIQRWAAKDKLERGQMNVVMKMEFVDDGCSSSLFRAIVTHEKEGKERKKIEVAEERKGIFLATTNTRNHLSLLSSL